MAQECDLSDILEEVRIIPFTFSGDDYPRDITRVDIKNNKIIISDSRHTIFIFNKNGKMISSSVSKIGIGPGEFSVVMAYSYNPYSSKMEVLTPEKMLFFDDRFNYIGEKELPYKHGENGKGAVYFSHIHDISDSIHILIPSPLCEYRDELWIFDSENEKILSKLSFEEGYLAGITMQDNCVYINGRDKLYLSRLVSRSISMSLIVKSVC